MLVIIGLVILVLAYYAFVELGRHNIIWTDVESGWCRIVMRWGKYLRILEPGRRLIGIPGMHTLYKRKMTFMKCVTDAEGNAKAERHDEKDIASFKTVRYPYALPFRDEEDCHALHLKGLLAVFATIKDYQKAFFDVSDWYAEMNTRILKVWRDLLVTMDYDTDIVGRDTDKEKKLELVSARLWKVLNSKAKKEGARSVLEELLETAGIEVHSVELVSVDPPEGWRETTLGLYKAEREKVAATQQAEASAILFGDTSQALKLWLVEQREAGNAPSRAQIAAKQDELRARALAKEKGYQELYVRGLENASTAVVGGNGVAAELMVGGDKGGRRNKGDDSDESDHPDFSSMTEAQKQAWAEKRKRRKGRND